MRAGEIVNFDAKKNFTYIRPLGKGGTGDTYLFRDETTNILFAIKKYVPKSKLFIEEQYDRFVDEIKIYYNIFGQESQAASLASFHLMPKLQ